MYNVIIWYIYIYIVKVFPPELSVTIHVYLFLNVRTRSSTFLANFNCKVSIINCSPHITHYMWNQKQKKKKKLHGLFRYSGLESEAGPLSAHSLPQVLWSSCSGWPFKALQLSCLRVKPGSQKGSSHVSFLVHC